MRLYLAGLLLVLGCAKTWRGDVYAKAIVCPPHRPPAADRGRVTGRVYLVLQPFWQRHSFVVRALRDGGEVTCDITPEGGDFLLGHLPPGDYSLEAVGRRFRVRVQAGATTRMNLYVFGSGHQYVEALGDFVNEKALRPLVTWVLRLPEARPRGLAVWYLHRWRDHDRLHRVEIRIPPDGHGSYRFDDVALDLDATQDDLDAIWATAAHMQPVGLRVPPPLFDQSESLELTWAGGRFAIDAASREAMTAADFWRFEAVAERIDWLGRDVAREANVPVAVEIDGSVGERLFSARVEGQPEFVPVSLSRGRDEIWVFPSRFVFVTEDGEGGYARLERARPPARVRIRRVDDRIEVDAP